MSLSLCEQGQRHAGSSAHCGGGTGRQVRREVGIRIRRNRRTTSRSPIFSCRKEGSSTDRSPGARAGAGGLVRTRHKHGPAARHCWALSGSSSGELLSNTVQRDGHHPHVTNEEAEAAYDAGLLAMMGCVTGRITQGRIQSGL